MQRPVMQTSGVLESLGKVFSAIRERREEIEEARRMPLDIVQALSRAGVFGLSVPRAIGGEEASPLDILRVIEAVAAADGSAGWSTMIGIGSNVSAGYMDETGAKEVFTDPLAPTAGIAAPTGSAVRVDGGVMVDGRWSFASGITHCQWVWAGCLVMEEGNPRKTPFGPEIVHAWMPVRDVVIHDVWHVSGLCGTGSNDFSAKELFVPNHRLFALLDPTGHRREPLYQMPPLLLFTFQVAAVSLGIARAALDELNEIAQTKKPTLYNQVLADKAVVHVELARAEAAVLGARAFLYDTVKNMWESVSRGGVPTKRDLAVGHIAATQA